LTGLSTFLGIIMGTAAVFTGTNTMLAALSARAREIGILVALGFRPAAVFMSFMIEALILGLMGGLVGCVMVEKYDAEKARALNFQRLLAQEEKRTGELDAELKKVKREASELEARSREMTAQLQAVREQLARIQEDAAAMREAAMLREREREELSRARQASKPKRAERVMPVPSESAAKPEAKADNSRPIYHEVKPGETLFRLSRQYGVEVRSIREWNHLQDDLIEVGQKLIVGHQ
ncbi:MAG: LysM peptidoglycan-binding domain-containing protein, partial [Nitrospirae bacterium]|nr:LysM peptidoglycan-binding domain-containing protein [Nitrospirota bacterium]